MLKNSGYSGTYHDNEISIGVLLENPSDYEIDVTELVFSFTLTAKNADCLKPEDFTFYVMDETNRLYNAGVITYSALLDETNPQDDEPTRCSDGLICVKLKPEFLFQDLRIAFLYRRYEKICIIELKH